MKHPVNTYRIQFHKDFNFARFKEIINYLQKLGVETIYASPIFKATPGSIHGYDVTNPKEVNPEIGSLVDLQSINQQLREKEIYWLQDIVPNHMAYHPDNFWLMDVLEKGTKSKYKLFFDTALSSQLMQGKLMVPFLGKPLQEAIKENELKLVIKEDKIYFKYFDQYYPVSSLTYKRIINFSGLNSNANEGLEDLFLRIDKLEEIVNEDTYALEWNKITSFLKKEELREFFDEALKVINASSHFLSKITKEQLYELCFWQETDQRINFRRFFTVNGLICLNIHDKEVFQDFHQFIKELIDEDVICGIRLDHIDGLLEPSSYLKNLRELVGDETYVVAEKILETGEEAPSDWEIQGNTGYDFLGMINNLLTSKDSEPAFTSFYKNLIGNDLSIEEQVFEKKSLILANHMQGELENLYTYLISLSLVPNTDAVQKDDLKKAIAAFLIYLPVYRYYGETFPLDDREYNEIAAVFEKIIKIQTVPLKATNLLREIILGKVQQNEQYQINAALFYKRCMQFSGPLMAKGVEDTLMYTNFRFIAHNEVGDHPLSFGISVQEFNELMKNRQLKSPLSINTTSTHDTKRGEDARARLNVISNLPQEWFQKVKEWQKINEPLRAKYQVTENDEYLIYQCIIGNFPMPGQPEDDFSPRLSAYLEKSLREGKANSNWTNPNEFYETNVQSFANALLDKNGDFWLNFEPFHQKIATYGLYNSLVQLVLKFTSPGIPDVYQGCELWDFSFVDPDNRRPVDYNLRTQLLNELLLEAEDDFLSGAGLFNNIFSGKIKLWLTHQLMKLRKEDDKVFTEGEYLPLTISGKYKDHIIAFARKYRNRQYVIIACLHIATLCDEQGCDIDEIDWRDTRIPLSDESEVSWFNILGEDKGKNQHLLLKDLNLNMPFALLDCSLNLEERNAGVLLHISSLPGKYGMGDLGSQAFQFANFLHKTKQRYWQILPLGPSGMEEFYSPYSALSSMAGNPLLINVDTLFKEGLLQAFDFEEYKVPPSNKINYIKSAANKFQILGKAWNNFLTKANEKTAFNIFCTQEAYWLNDFSLFMVLKEYFNTPWYNWPINYREREAKALNRFIEEYNEEITKQKWFQFKFYQQWQKLKNYCNRKRIKIIGDLPFYVNYNSADVWANREIFSVDIEGKMIGVAGVPPDYFSEDGQLWGMPVFRWDKLKAQNYKWWIQRIKKNLELYDLVRLDHFRAFADYWEVPANEITAKNGTWQPGPGMDFFDKLKAELKDLPFIAEDLGEITDEVYALRDEFNLPGMKVLQFAFGNNVSDSPHGPHHHAANYFSYTGTHDNNTTKGWFRLDADKVIQSNLTLYTGQQITEHNVHEAFNRLVYASVAKTAIVPMQDLLGLDETARMNTPGSVDDNWQWQMLPDAITPELEEKIKKQMEVFGRD